MKERRSDNLTKKQWNTLCNEWAHACRLYQMCEDLFSSERTRDLLNAVDGPFFATIQEELYYSLTMRLTRLTEEDKRGRVTLSVLGTDNPEQLKLIRTARSATAKLRKLRNARLAHIYPEREVEGVNLPEMREPLDLIWRALECSSFRKDRTSIWNPLGVDEDSRKTDRRDLVNLSLTWTIERLITGYSWATKDWPTDTGSVLDLGSNHEESHEVYDCFSVLRRLQSKLGQENTSETLEDSY